MVTVPTYQRNVSLRPDYQQGIDVRATPEAFGASVGRGMQQAASGLDQFAEAMRQVQELEDVTRAKEADNAYAGWLRERQYGENGFMTLQGRNAVDQRKSFEEEAEAKRLEFGKGLTPGAAKAYQNASQSRLQSTFQQSIVHAAQERKRWFNEASASRVETFANDALVNFTNPDAVTKNIAAGQAEIRQQAQMLGWDADTLKQREGAFISGVHKNIALRIAQDDPLKANDYVKANAKQMTGADQYDMNRTLESAVAEEQSKREADAILSQGRKLADQPGDMVAEVAAAGATGPRAGPTRSKGFLASISAHKDRAGDTLNLDDTFADNLAAFIQDAPPEIRKGLGIGSGWRSNEKQKELFEGSDKSGHSVAFPAGYRKPDGTIAKGSNHLHGRAVDLTYNGARLDSAPPDVVRWVHQNASKYGLFFPMGWEPWHVEPTGSRSGTVAARSNNVAPRATLPSYDDIETRLANISDPKVRDLTRKRLYSAIEMQNRAYEANEKAAKAELWRYVDQGATPDQVPLEVRQAAGMAAVSSAWDYTEKAAKRQEVESDETLLYDMRRYAASSPTEFANVDLNDYRDRLSKEAIKELTGLQTGALTDQRKAREEGLTLTTAFSQAESQLSAVGLSTAGKEGSAREEAARRIAQFQNTLAAEMEAFKQANDGKKPNQIEIQSMINRLLLPVVVKQPQSMFGIDSLWPDSNREGFLFETGGKLGDLGNGIRSEVAVDYQKIPVDQRIQLEVTLEKVLGYKPSEEQVEAAYAKYLSERK